MSQFNLPSSFQPRPAVIAKPLVVKDVPTVLPGQVDTITLSKFVRVQSEIVRAQYKKPKIITGGRGCLCA